MLTCYNPRHIPDSILLELEQILQQSLLESWGHRVPSQRLQQLGNITWLQDTQTYKTFNEASRPEADLAEIRRVEHLALLIGGQLDQFPSRSCAGHKIDLRIFDCQKPELIGALAKEFQHLLFHLKYPPVCVPERGL